VLFLELTYFASPWASRLRCRQLFVLAAGHNAFNNRRHSQQAESFGNPWSALGLTGEGRLSSSLLFGPVVGTSSPPWPLAQESAPPEWFIKTAIVSTRRLADSQAAAPPASFKAINVPTAGPPSSSLPDLAGLSSISWPGASSSSAASGLLPWAAGISSCGVSPPSPTGAGIAPGTWWPVMVSTWCGTSSVVELILLPFGGRTFHGGPPMVAAAWRRLGGPYGGAAISSGASTQPSLIPRASTDDPDAS